MLHIESAASIGEADDRVHVGHTPSCTLSQCPTWREHTQHPNTTVKPCTTKTKCNGWKKSSMSSSQSKTKECSSSWSNCRTTLAKALTSVCVFKVKCGSDGKERSVTTRHELQSTTSHRCTTLTTIKPSCLLLSSRSFTWCWLSRWSHHWSCVNLTSSVCSSMCGPT